MARPAPAVPRGEALPGPQAVVPGKRRFPERC
jgi:hypothetical protein